MKYIKNKGMSHLKYVHTFDESETKYVKKKIMFVTSFSMDIYQNCGHNLITSWNEYMAGDKTVSLLVCKENCDMDFNYNNMIDYEMGKDKYLLSWLKDNEDIIPDYLGGKATQKKRPDIFENEWNRKASRWFRKIVALKYAHENYGKHNLIVWIDADCYFIKKLKKSVICDMIGGNGCLYLLGKERKEKDYGVESGFLVFSKKNGGYQLLRELIDEFTTGRFRGHDRWDDGYVFRKVLETTEVKTKDACQNLYRLRVMERSIFQDYVVHNKGVNKKNEVMV